MSFEGVYILKNVFKGNELENALNDDDLKLSIQSKKSDDYVSLYNDLFNNVRIQKSLASIFQTKLLPIALVKQG